MTDADAAGDGPRPLDREPGGPSFDDALLGDPLGLRSAAAGAGLSAAPYLIVDASKNVRGGLDTEGSALRHLLSVNVSLDLAEAFGGPAGRVYADLQQQGGQPGSDEVGDFQYVGNYDADGRTQLAELWVEVEVVPERLRVRAGKIDANYGFGYGELAYEFVHGSSGYPATIAVLPTYPDPAFGVDAFAYPTEHLYAGVGAFDGALQEGVATGGRGPSTLFGSPADLFLIAEVGGTWSMPAGGGLAGRAGVGAWYHTGTFDEFGGGSRGGTGGGYLVADQTTTWSGRRCSACGSPATRRRGFRATPRRRSS